MLERRAKIAKLILFGKPTQQEIADKLGLDHTTVSKHLKAIRDEWKQQAQEDIGEVIKHDLRKLDAIESEALEQWERSKKDGQKKVAEGVSAAPKTGKAGKADDDGASMPNKVKIETWGQCGDPRYLKIILDCQERRAKLLGMDKPTKVAPTDPDGNELPQGPVIVALPAQLDAETWARAFSKKPG